MVTLFFNVLVRNDNRRQAESRGKLAWLCRGAKEEDDSQPTPSREQSQPTSSRELSQACLALPRREGGRRSQACLGYAMARTDGTARGEAEFTQTIQSRDGRIQKSKRTIKNVMSMSMAGRISEEKSSFLSTHTSLIDVLYGGAAVVYSPSS